MKYDIILAGVGGQGVLSLAAIIDMAAMEAGLNVRQSEVHGMAQRGGAVLSHLRLSDEPIYSDLIAKGTADLVLSMEPLESLRYTDYLKPEGRLVSAEEPFLNIPNYPEKEDIYTQIRSIAGHSLIKSSDLAKEAGHSRAANMVMVGAASKYLPLSQEVMKKAVEQIFSRKGEEVIQMNLKAIELGRGAA